MVRVFVRHPVHDFTSWKQEYDNFDANRKQMGVRHQAVYQASDDPKDITVIHDFDSIESARRFVESDALRGAMDRAGVAGDPDIWFTESA